MMEFVLMVALWFTYEDVFEAVMVFLTVIYAISFKVSKDIDKEWEEEDNSTIVRFFERPPNDRHHN